MVDTDSTMIEKAREKSQEGGGANEARELRRLANKWDLTVINTSNGEVMLSCSVLGLTGIRGQLPLISTDQILVFSESGIERKITTSLVNIATSKVLWSNDELYSEDQQPDVRRQKNAAKRSSYYGNQPLLWLPDSTFLELLSTIGLRRIDSKTGNVLWKSDIEINRVPFIDQEYIGLQLSADNQYVYVPRKKDLHKIRLLDGHSAWTEPQRLAGRVMQLEELDSCIVIMGGGVYRKKSYPRFIDILSAHSGQSILRKSLNYQVVSRFDIVGHEIVYNANRSLMTLNLLEDHRANKIAKLILPGNDQLNSVEYRDQGYIVVGKNSLVKFDINGDQLFSTYFKPPGRSVLAQVALSATQLAASYFLYTQADLLLLKSNPALKQYYASQYLDKYMYILTNVHGGNSTDGKQMGLLKLNKSNGRIEGRVKLGTKKPNYRVDPLTGNIIFMKDENEIVCYGFSVTRESTVNNN